MSVDNVDILGFRWILSEGNLVAPRYTPDVFNNSWCHRRKAVRNSTITVSLDTPDQDHVSTLTRGSVGGLGCVCHCIARRLFADNLRAFFTFPEYGNIAWRTVISNL
jgi:hypothetical protein